MTKPFFQMFNEIALRNDYRTLRRYTINAATRGKQDNLAAKHQSFFLYLAPLNTPRALRSPPRRSSRTSFRPPRSPSCSCIRSQRAYCDTTLTLRGSRADPARTRQRPGIGRRTILAEGKSRRRNGSQPRPRRRCQPFDKESKINFDIISTLSSSITSKKRSSS